MGNQLMAAATGAAPTPSMFAPVSTAALTPDRPNPTPSCVLRLLAPIAEEAQEEEEEVDEVEIEG